MVRNILVAIAIVSILFILFYFFPKQKSEVRTYIPIVSTYTPTPTPLFIPSQKILTNEYHIFQTFNNCGPAALSMALSYYGHNVSQKILGDQLRPHQNPQGDNDDKSVTLAELAKEAKKYNLIPYHRPNGNPKIIKAFIAYDMPVIVRTWLKPTEDIGHYRVIKGYNETTREFIQDDSLQGKNLRYNYGAFDEIWNKFTYEYLVLVPIEKQKIAEAILQEDVDEHTAWNKAIHNAKSEFNRSVALYHIGEFQQSVEAFEKVEHELPFRTLWYQIEPILSYAELGHDDRVLEITSRILANHNRAFSELYILRGNIYKKRGDVAAAQNEFDLATFYNKNLEFLR